MDILSAAKQLCPNGDFNLRGNVLEISEGSNYTGPLPSMEDINSLLQATAYVKKRALEYPPLQDLADALVHKENGDPSHYNNYIAQCNAIKAKYPKPQ